MANYRDSSDSSSDESDEPRKNCLFFREKPPSKTYLENKDDFDFSAALESVYPLTDLICFYLSFKTLDSISQVSRQWKESALREMQKRNQISWIKAIAKKDSYKYKLVTNKYFEFSSKQSAVFFVQSDHLKEFICCHANMQVTKCMRNRHLYPHIWKDLIKPRDMEFVCLTLDDLGTFVDSDKKLLYCGYFFPQIPNVRIKQFSYPIQLPRNKRIFDEFMLDNETLDCLLIFSTCPSSNINQLVKEIDKRQSTPVSVGGGIVGGIKTHNKRVVTSQGCRCIAFLKKSDEDCSFYSASIVIRPGHNFERKATRFKQSLVFKENSVVFRFCCSGKDTKYSEGPILKRIFPNSELIELIVDGEICISNIPKFGSDTDEIIIKKQKKCFEATYEFSTVLVFLTWNTNK